MRQLPRQESTPYHEAGHAVAGIQFGVPVRRATIVPSDEYCGAVESSNRLRLPSATSALENLNERLRRQIQMHFAGPIAEERFLREYGCPIRAWSSLSGSGRDYENAWELASLFELLNQTQSKEQWLQPLWEEVRAFVDSVGPTKRPYRPDKTR